MSLLTTAATTKTKTRGLLLLNHQTHWWRGNCLLSSLRPCGGVLPISFSTFDKRSKSLIQSKNSPDNPKHNNVDDDKNPLPHYEEYVSSLKSSAKSVRSSFFSYTSGRAKRRRQLHEWKQQRARRRLLMRDNGKSKEGNEEEEEVDTRTVSDLIFPNPYKGMPPPTPIAWPKTIAEWKHVLQTAWAQYVWTWKGFWTSRGFLVEDEDEIKKREEEERASQQAFDDQKRKAGDNFKENAEFAKKEALQLRNTVQDATGIKNAEDLKRWAADAMRLASECVKEFMSGYRKGRDDEVENVLRTYFQELKEKVVTATAHDPSKRKRRIKRRIRNRFHRSLLLRRR